MHRKINNISSHNQGGFSALILIIMLVLMLAVGGITWYIWNQNKAQGTNQANNNSTTEEPQNDQTPNLEPVDPSENGKYLVIKEWGVRFELPEELRGDVKYGIETTNNKQTAWFEIGSIAELPGSSCKLMPVSDAGSSGYIGGIGVFVTRSAVQVTGQDALMSRSETNITGNWYYVFPMRDGCIGLSGTNSEEADNFTKRMVQAAESLTESLEHLEPIPE
jgi:hypothetical protein